MTLDRIYDFAQQLQMSAETQGRSLETLIADLLPGVVAVVKTSTDQDKTGIDYIATLRRGGSVFIDTKKREKGVANYWRWGEEELALEIWSVCPTATQLGRVGWTLDESKQTHYTLHFFDPSDSQRVFLLPFQLLRKAFREHYREWCATYPKARQNSGSWHSECLFVPAPVVLQAIQQAMLGVS